VSGVGFSQASGIGWEQYYRAIEGRPLRALLVDAMPFLPTTDDQALVAIDLGCGDGTETLALLARGWKHA
jgi:tellurite methyltransferase